MSVHSRNLPPGRGPGSPRLDGLYVQRSVAPLGTRRLGTHEPQARQLPRRPLERLHTQVGQPERLLDSPRFLPVYLTPTRVRAQLALSGAGREVPSQGEGSG